MRLYHYTCEHAAAAIGRAGEIRPFPQPALGGVAIAWFTDLAEPDKTALGLQSTILTCDRIERRFEVDTDLAKWCDIAGTLARYGFLPLQRRVDLERGRKPQHWFCAIRPVAVG